ncbi:MAG: hypothetical protein AAF937_08550 [Planctomycetota bacterium]
MTDFDPRDQRAVSLGFGEYQIVRSLRPRGDVERYLVSDPDRQTHHVAFRLGLPDSCGRETFLDAVSRSSVVRSAHVLQVEQFAFTGDHAAWIISPYTGDHDGLLLLSDLLTDKGGQFDAAEVRRAVLQLAEALCSIHDACGSHGALSLDSVQVNRAGTLLVELPGLCGAGGAAASFGISSIHAEIRSLVAITYELLTGIAPTDDLIMPSRLVDGLDPRWDRFVLEGLDAAGGYSTLDELHEGLDNVANGQPVVEIRTKRAVRRFGLRRGGTGVSGS